MATSISPSQGYTMSAHASTTPAPHGGCEETRLIWQVGIRVCVCIVGMIPLTMPIVWVHRHSSLLPQR